MPCDNNTAASACKCLRESEGIKWDCVQQEVCDMNIMNEDEMIWLNIIIIDVIIIMNIIVVNITIIVEIKQNQYEVLVLENWRDKRILI